MECVVVLSHFKQFSSYIVHVVTKVNWTINRRTILNTWLIIVKLHSIKVKSCKNSTVKDPSAVVSLLIRHRPTRSAMQKWPFIHV